MSHPTHSPLENFFFENINRYYQGSVGAKNELIQWCTHTFLGYQQEFEAKYGSEYRGRYPDTPTEPILKEDLFLLSVIYFFKSVVGDGRLQYEIPGSTLEAYAQSAYGITNITDTLQYVNRFRAMHGQYPVSLGEIASPGFSKGNYIFSRCVFLLAMFNSPEKQNSPLSSYQLIHNLLLQSVQSTTVSPDRIVRPSQWPFPSGVPGGGKRRSRRRKTVSKKKRKYRKSRRYGYRSKKIQK